MSETLYTRDTADEAYGANRRDIVGNRGGEGGEQSKTILQNIIESDPVQGTLAPWKLIGKGVGAAFSDRKSVV